MSACVIDHLWHLTESGYYHRKADLSAVHVADRVDRRHQHQKAAYCGIHYFDSDAYPPEYRRRLYMGNIHGDCINVDFAQPRRARRTPAIRSPDFLSANDAWFMPVVQKTGPDGCLYVLDWYDRYHCYQDAGRDPKGIDRGQGRLYRVRIRTRRAPAVRSEKKATSRCRAAAQPERLLPRHGPAALGRPGRNPVAAELDLGVRRRGAARRGCTPVGSDRHEPAADSVRCQATRTCGRRSSHVGRAHHGAGSPSAREIKTSVAALSVDPSPEVRLQVAIAAGKLSSLDTVDGVDVLTAVLASSGHDPLISPHCLAEFASQDRRPTRGIFRGDRA